MASHTVHSTFALNGVNGIAEQRKLINAAKQGGANLMYTTSVPQDNYDKLLSEVQKLKPQKRKNWKGLLVDAHGQKTRVRYVADGIRMPEYDFTSHFENKMSGLTKSKYGTQEEWRVVIPKNLPKVGDENIDEVLHFRTQRDVGRDGMSPQEQSLDFAAEALANHTGNHEPRNHRINVPTRAGEPVRG